MERLGTWTVSNYTDNIGPPPFPNKVKLTAKWEDNCRRDLQEVGCGSMDWIEMAQERDRWRALVTAVMNLRFRKIGGIS
jgi:hypothetical protein